MTEQAEPQAPPPVITANPVEVADGVFVIPDGRVPLVPNVGIVLGTRAALVVDTGMGVRSAECVLDHAKRLAGDRRLLLTITHFHPEHGYGAHVFADEATIVYNRSQRDELRRKGAPYVELFKTFGPAVAQELEGVQFVDPHVAYDGSVEIDLGGRTARLLEFGLAHTAGDQVVLVDGRVLFGGDLFETRMFPIVPFFPPDDTDVDGDHWIAVLGKLLELEPSVVVAGHGELTDSGLIEDVREYLSFIRGEARRGVEDAQAVDDVVAAVERSAAERWPDWDNPEWVGFAVRAFSAQATS
jgi:glyoxylase-like metal-dependent hydrolase (beta-lactamase superfamily II)